MAPVGPGASAPAAVVALCGVLASAGGMIAYGVMSAQKLEVLIDQWIPFWFALNLGVLSVEALYLNYKPGAFLGHLNVYINIGYIMWAVLAIIISMISYAVIGWASPAIWAAVGIVPCGLIGYLTKLRGTEGGGEKPSIACMICHFFNFFIKFAHVAVLFFLLFGAAAIAWSENNFAARGKMTGIALSDGVTYNIHVLCEGSGSDNRPTVWIVPPSTHGTPDLYGVQNAMVELGWKVCTFDPPGYAWSDPLRSSLLGPSWNGIFDSILDADEETGASPVVLVAWNTGGGDVAVEFAHRVPERVSALVLLEVNPPGVEWDEYQARENVGDGERKSYKVKTLDERKYVAGLMLGIMAPSGGGSEAFIFVKNSV
uniref:AB hydrolase-1 domain-containing protein n=1 Tax=Chromera velia CCMP2878 TaxID=1169474 RepID=A0A0K6S635_9ALVE|eukprot:Cvel_15999.t1-p1 / transcript=Cvel_15999.t1 / gene=Cvel_15999 / organism=Chromera_velia_CCMP2878 / gene_product=hypothetical protein / transcript_product=hypothetical protein / location=Cvel_scaffold1213:26833-29681(+) / protein_length=370 / sequence_SO=supercontig / SO=protein_coding / is_pseudo=false